MNIKVLFKSTISVILLFVTVFSFTSCIFDFFIKPDHKLNIIFPSARDLEKTDILDVYNGKGELIESFSTEGKLAYQITYNELEYEEVCTIYSHNLDKSEKFLTIKSYDEDAWGTGEAGMYRHQIAKFDLMMHINYYDESFEAEWRGNYEYNTWSEGGFNVKLKLLNTELLKDKDFGVYASPIYINNDEKVGTLFVACNTYTSLKDEYEVFLPKGDKWDVMNIRLKIDDEFILENEVSISEERDCEFTVDLSEYLD